MSFFFRVSALLVLFSPGLYAQFWEHTGGPGGDLLFSATIAPSGDVYVLSKKIHRSTDFGTTWQLITPPATIMQYYSQLICTENGTLYLSNNSFLWRSKDGGAQWTRLCKLTNNTVASLSPAGSLIICASDTVRVSTDEGATWSHSVPQAGVWCVRAAIDHDGIMYAGYDNKQSFRSTNNGLSWMKIINGLPMVIPSEFLSFEQTKVFCRMGSDLYQSVDSGRIWKKFYTTQYLGNFYQLDAQTFLSMNLYGEIFRSTDGGISWALYNTDLKSVGGNYPIGLYVRDQVMFMLFRSTLYRQFFGAGSWYNISVPTGIMNALVPSSTGAIYGISASGSGATSLWSYNEGSGWEAQTGVGGVSTIAVDSAGRFYGIKSGNVISSFNNGQTWNTAIGIPGAGHQIALTEDLVFVSSEQEGVYRTSDRGASWDQLTLGLENKVIHSVAATKGYVYAGGDTKFYRSSDQGWTWEQPVFPFITGSERVKAIAAHDASVIVAVDRTGVYFSRDNGTLWENHSQGLTGDTVFSMVETPSGSVFLATTTGVYEYLPSTQRWNNVTQGIDMRVLSLTLGKDGKVYAGSDGKGVYRSTKTYGTWFKGSVDRRYEAEGLSVYPNPATTNLTIEFKNSMPGNSRVVAYNLLGNVMPIALQCTGDRLQIDISLLSPGKYMLRVEAGDKVDIVPVIVQ